MLNKLKKTPIPRKYWLNVPEETFPLLARKVSSNQYLRGCEYKSSTEHIGVTVSHPNPEQYIHNIIEEINSKVNSYISFV